MGEVSTILLIPPEGSTLFADMYAPHLFGFLRCKEHGDTWMNCTLWTDNNCDHCDECSLQKVLILARDGKVQRHGCLALADHWYRRNGQDDLGSSAVHFAGIAGDVCMVARGHREYLTKRIAEQYPGARLVFLDSDGGTIDETT